MQSNQLNQQYSTVQSSMFEKEHGMNLNLRTSNPKKLKKKTKNKLNIKLHVNGHKHQSRFYRTCMFTLSVSNQARFSLKTDHIPYQ